MSGPHEVADICVVGGGPAGAVLAIRLAHLGFRTVLVEEGRPRHGHRAESLSPGVATQLDLIDARAAVERAGFAEFRHARMRWADDQPLQGYDHEPAILVDRARFAACLREIACAAGARVLEPATIRGSARGDAGWHLRIQSDGGAIEVDAAFLAVAGGRAMATGSRRQTGPRTLAISSVWHGAGLPAEPCIEAGAEAWYWGMPGPDGGYEATVFVDPRRFRRDRTEKLPVAFERLLAGSLLLAGCDPAERAGPVEAADATAYTHSMPVDAHSIRIGEAALALDPLSSSGVQRAIQSALAGAAVINTLLCRPSMTAAALAFYRANTASAAERHRGWGAALYRAAAIGRDSSFWSERASLAAAPQPAAQPSQVPRPDLRVSLAAEASFAATPCIVGDFVATRNALHHPRLDEPVAFLGGHELAPLLGGMRPGMTAGDLVKSWSGQVALRPAVAIVGWMLERGVLVASPNHPHAASTVRNPI